MENNLAVGIRKSVFHYEMKSRRTALGLTQRQVAEQCGMSLKTYSKIETFRQFPATKQADAISLVLGQSVDKLFPEWSKLVYKKRKAKIEVHDISFVSLESPTYRMLEAPDNIEDNLFDEETKDRIEQILETLGPREREIVKMRFGFYGKQKTLEEVGKHFMVTRERIREIEMKAMGKLKCPSRADKLREIYANY